MADTSLPLVGLSMCSNLLIIRNLPRVSVDRDKSYIETLKSLYYGASTAFFIPLFLGTCKRGDIKQHLPKNFPTSPLDQGAGKTLRS